jgi:hypothetical protein
MRLRFIGPGLLAAAAAIAAVPGAGAQTAPACQSNAGANIDRPRLVAWERTGIVKVFAETDEAAATGVFSITAKDPAHPIAHPVSLPYAQLGEEEGNRRFRFRAERNDGDAVVSFKWTKVENNRTCQAHVEYTMAINKGRRPYISIGHERTSRIIFGHESPDCTETQVVSWKVEIRGPGGRVRELTKDVCGKIFHRKGSNAHFTLTARSGVIVFRAKRPPGGSYQASYRVVVGKKVVVHGGLRVRLRRGRPIVVISIKRL